MYIPLEAACSYPHTPVSLQVVCGAAAGKGAARAEEPPAGSEPGDGEAEGRRGGAGEPAGYADVPGGDGQGLPARRLPHGPIPGRVPLKLQLCGCLAAASVP